MSQQQLLPVLESAAGQNFYACYQCGKCTAACPFDFAPQRVMRHLQLGQIEEALTQETTWVCASCLTCSRVCPKSADPAGVMKALRSVRTGLLELDSTEEGDGNERRALTGLADRHYRRYRHALRSHLFANIHDISQRGSRLAPVSNWATKLPGAKLLAHHLLGIHRERPLPEFVRPSFPQWFRQRQTSGNGHRGEVLLFHDTFMDYDAPEIGVAVTELLELAGYRVALTDTVCCGRPMISKGYVDRAKDQARANVVRLHAQVKAGAYIVGCEPSCLLTVREEYPRMLAGSDLEVEAVAVAERCLLIDEFLADGQRGADLRLDAPEGRELLFHGHCQQKAEADPQRSMELLHRAGFRAEMVAAPCCGMAGAFGFEREHYAASRAAFGRALGPALQARPDALLVVMGISCRKQIEHFAGRRARHLVQVLREAADTAAAETRHER